MDYYISLLEKNLNEFFSRLRQTIPSREKIGVLVSGGIDSSIIAYFTLKFFPDATLFSFGTNINKDEPYLNILQKHFHKQIEFLRISRSDICNNLPETIKILKKYNIVTNIMQQSLGLGYYLIFEKAQQLGISIILTGQGPDILLAGYHKYKKEKYSQLNEVIRQDLGLLDTDKKRDSAMAERFSIKLFNPYLDSTFVDLSLEIPGELKLKSIAGSVIEKYILRMLGRKLGLPKEIVSRPKMAFQYSSGIQKAVKKLL